MAAEDSTGQNRCAGKHVDISVVKLFGVHLHLLIEVGDVLKHREDVGSFLSVALEPRMVEGLSRAVTESRVSVQHFDDQILCFRVDLVPIPWLELDLSFLVLEQDLMDVGSGESRSSCEPIRDYGELLT